jgi:AcrR family transcriptional regulator
MTVNSTAKEVGDGAAELTLRRRILDAASAAFKANGYADTSMLEIATRAHFSKRELYAQIGNKQEILTACIAERAKRFRVPADLPVPRDRAGFAAALAAIGMQILREVTEAEVISFYRIAIAEVLRAPEVARALDSIGRAANRETAREIMRRARQAGIVDGEPAEMAERLVALLWGDLLTSLLLGVAEPPRPREIARRARAAAAAFLLLYPPPAAPEAGREGEVE